MITIDPNSKPTNSTGIAYMQLCEERVLGYDVMPKEIEDKVGEALVKKFYDFCPMQES